MLTKHMSLLLWHWCYLAEQDKLLTEWVRALEDGRVRILPNSCEPIMFGALAHCARKANDLVHA